MLQILQLIFSSFWVWLGTMFLLGAFSSLIVRICDGIISLIKGKKSKKS